MKTFFLIGSFFALTQGVTAQNISGTVKADGDGPLNKASVSLVRAKDSSLVKLSISDKAGQYDFKEIQNGAYKVMATSVGYNPVYSTTFEYNGSSYTVPDLLLEKAGTEMAGVTVTAKKPLVEVRADKMIVNVEGTINATGNDGLELLRKSPGVVVDKDDNISLSGKNGVQVYIDGKPSPLRGADLASYLRSLQSSSIEAIELITNPSAKYEAAGNAGIINIRLKKDKSLGTNGNVNLGYNIGQRAKYNAGLSLNHRTKKMNLFGNYNYFNGDFANSMGQYKEQADSIFNQRNKSHFSANSHNFKAGADYFINPKNTVGVIVNGNFSDNNFYSNGPMTIAPKATGIVNRILVASSDNDRNRENINFNVNYRYTNNKDRELNIDADYGWYDLMNNQYVPNIYYSADGKTELSRNVYRMKAPTNIDIYSLKIDYEQPFAKGKLGYGGKVAKVQTKNDFQRFDVINNTDVHDRDRSNKFDYDENINALYVNYNRAFKGFMVQAGLRMENTNADGVSTGEKETGNGYVPYDSTISRNYVDFFPSAAITFNKNPMSQWNFTYSRRIDRPNYDNLNPFEFKLNDYTYSRGNTELRPQYTNSFGVTYTYKYKLNTTLNYSHVTNMFAQLLDTIEGSKTFQTTENLATQDVVSLNISYPFSYKKFSSFINVNSNYSIYKADFGGGDRVVDLKAFSLVYYMQNSMKFGKDWTAEVTALYLSPFVWGGTFKGKSMSSIDAGLQKTVLKGKGTLRANVTDIFGTMSFRGHSHYAGAYNKIHSGWESRQFKLSLNYRFGNAQVKAARQRKTGLDDESKRTNGGGGSPAPAGNNK
ncbi:MAG: TonB-dependent receptor [Niabella sp.]